MKEFHQEERLFESVAANVVLSASEILEVIVKVWQDFISNLPQEDDLTLFVVKRID